MIIKNSIGISVLFSLLVCSSSGQFFVDWSDHVMDIVETPFIRTENLVIDAKVYEYVDLQNEMEKQANIRQLEEMVQRDDQKFRDMIVSPTQLQQQQLQQQQYQQQQQLQQQQHQQQQQQQLQQQQQQQQQATNNLQRIESQLRNQWENPQIQNQAQTQGQTQTKTQTQTGPQTVKENVESATITIPLLLLLILSPIVFSAILGVAVCMIRRRRSLGRRDEDDDEERLLKPRKDQAEPSELKRRLNELGKSGLSKTKNWVNIIKRCPVEKRRAGDKSDISPADDYQELCRQRMEANSDKCSPISSTMCTNISQMNTPGLSGINTSTINSTPIRITNEKNSNSSDSERNSS